MKKFFRIKKHHETPGPFSQVDYKKSHKKLHQIALSGEVAKFAQLEVPDPNVIDKNSRTLLHLACAKGNLEIVNRLLKIHSAKHDIIDSQCRTPLLTAAFENQTACMMVLLERGADPKVRDIYGNNVLHYLAYHENLAISQGLENIMKELFVKNSDGNTPLHLAVNLNRLEMCKFFIKNKCDLNAENNLSETALIIAAKREHTDIALMLLSEDVDQRIIDCSGKTAFTYSFDRKNERLLNYLNKFQTDSRKDGFDRRGENDSPHKEMEKKSETKTTTSKISETITNSTQSNTTELEPPSTISKEDFETKSDISPPSCISELDIKQKPCIIPGGDTEINDKNEHNYEMRDISASISDKYQKMKKLAAESFSPSSSLQELEIPIRKSPKSDKIIHSTPRDDWLEHSQDIIDKYRLLTDKTKQILNNDEVRFNKMEIEIDNIKQLNQKLSERLDSFKKRNMSANEDISDLKNCISKLIGEFSEFKLPIQQITARLESLENERNQNTRNEKLEKLNLENEEVKRLKNTIHEFMDTIKLQMENNSKLEKINDFDKIEFEHFFSEKFQDHETRLMKLIDNKLEQRKGPDRGSKMANSTELLAHTTNEGFEMINENLTENNRRTTFQFEKLSERLKNSEYEYSQRLKNIEGLCRDISAKREDNPYSESKNILPEIVKIDKSIKHTPEHNMANYYIQMNGYNWATGRYSSNTKAKSELLISDYSVRFCDYFKYS